MNVIKKIKHIKQLTSEWYILRKILGNKWAIFYFLLGGREAGKSYAVSNFFVDQFVNKGRPFYWLRLTEASQKKILMNNAEKLVENDIRVKYNLDLVTRGDSVYQVLARDESGKVIDKKFMCRVMALSTFYNDKGSSLFDAGFLKDKNQYYNICLDEMNREKNEKKSFDIVYAFTNQLENLVRSTKQRVRVICIGNTLEDASDILCAFNFIPEKFGTYKLCKHKHKLQQLLVDMDSPDKEIANRAKQEYSELLAKDRNYFGKRAIIEYIEPSEKYLNRRRGTIADILMPTASTFTNKIETDNTLVNTKRLTEPQYVIKFEKDRDSWFTVWKGNTIARYNGEKKPVIPMKPYLDEVYNAETVKQIITAFDTRSYMYKNLVTFKLFQKYLTLLKPRQ